MKMSFKLRQTRKMIAISGQTQKNHPYLLSSGKLCAYHHTITFLLSGILRMARIWQRYSCVKTACTEQCATIQELRRQPDFPNITSIFTSSTLSLSTVASRGGDTSLYFILFKICTFSFVNVY